MAEVQPTFASMEMALARFRSRFIHPFGTSHGLRDGTDVVFVRLTMDGHSGYGEAALPPYLEFRQDSVIEELKAIDLNHIVKYFLLEVRREYEMELSPPARAALHSAYSMLISKGKNIPFESMLLNLERPSVQRKTMVTLGHSDLCEIPMKLSELPASSFLKVKLGSPTDELAIVRVKELDNRSLILDTNQGWNSVEQALDMIGRIGSDRIVGLEQPFPKHRLDLHAELKTRTTVPIYADESVQSPEDVDTVAHAFHGINLKLMKCGGLDRAVDMIRLARDRGLKVMLGSMSETSLGCGAMACLADHADLLDLDGPWLISNDPFVGLWMEGGELCKKKAPGFGIDLNPEAVLDWVPIGA